MKCPICKLKMVKEEFQVYSRGWCGCGYREPFNCGPEELEDAVGGCVVSSTHGGWQEVNRMVVDEYLRQKWFRVNCEALRRRS